MSKYIAVLFLLLLPLIAGWGPPHHYISEIAIESLPRWQQDMIEKQKKDFISTYCIIPDLIRKPATRQQWKAYGPPEWSRHCASTAKENYAIHDYLFKISHKKFKEENIEEAMKFIGSYSHFLQDSTCPAHFRFGPFMKTYPDKQELVQINFLKRFMPVPEKYESVDFHGVIDNGGFNIEQLRETVGKYKPKLLGASVDEAIFNISIEYEKYVDDAGHFLIPMVSAFLEDDNQKRIQYGTTAAAISTKLCADMVYTLLCVATNRFDPNDLTQLKKEVYLSDMPLNTRYKLTSQPNYRGQLLRNKCGTITEQRLTFPEGLKDHPLKLKMPDGSVKTFDKGFGSGPDSQYDFIIPKGLFKTFSVYVGQHAEIGNKGKCGFEILLDGISAAKIGAIKGNESAKLLTVKLKNAHKITIKTTGTKDAYTHAIWAEPILKK